MLANGRFFDYHIIRFSAGLRRRRLLYIFSILLFTQEYLPIDIILLLLLKGCTTLYVATINKNERARRFNDGGGVGGDLRK